VDLDEVAGKLNKGKYQLDADDQRLLQPNEIIFQVWPELPPNNQLQVFVTLCGVGSPMLVHVGGECFIRPLCPSSGHLTNPLPEGDKPVDSRFVRQRNTRPPESMLHIEAVDEKINEELDSLRGVIEIFLKNPEPRTWIPPDSVTPSNREFLTNLGIPSYRNGNPSLLLHNLDVCDDKEIETIFAPGPHQYVVINCALTSS
jgi:hypothetical protein